MSLLVELVEADAYARYSSNMQDEGNSIEYQMEEIEAYAQKHGMTIRHWYIDKAKSAKQVAGRDSFYELIEDIKSGDSAPNLIVWRTNRIFRNSYESHKYRRFLREKKIKLLSVTQAIDEETSSGRLTTSILSDIDEYKSAEIAEHVTAAMRSMVKKGFYTGQRMPLGYKTVDAWDGDKPRKKYAIDEETAPIVRKCFEDFVAGVPQFAIRKWLKDIGIRTKAGNPYDADALRTLLKNETYIGTRVYRVKDKEPLIVPNSVPAIIDEETFDAAQHIFLTRKRNDVIKGRRHNEIRTYFLTGKAVCAKCNGPFIGKMSNGYAYYICQKRARRKECDCKGIQKAQLEPAVFQAIRENIFSEQAIEEVVKVALAEVKKNPIKTTKSKSELTKRKNTLMREIAEIVQMKLDGEISKDIMASMKKPKEDELAEIEIDLHALEQHKKTVVDEDFVRNYINDLFVKSESGDDGLLKYVVEKTVESVVIGESEVIINLAVLFGKNTHRAGLAFPKWSKSVKISRKAMRK